MSKFRIGGGGGLEGGILTRKWNMVKNLPGGMSMWSPNQLSNVSIYNIVIWRVGVVPTQQ